MKNLQNLLLLLFLITLEATNPKNAKADFYQQRILCEKNYGAWREFGDNCANNCESKITSLLPICIETITFNCDCGEEKCWDGNKCLNVKSYLEKIAENKKEIKTKELTTLNNKTNSQSKKANQPDIKTNKDQKIQQFIDDQTNLVNQNQSKIVEKKQDEKNETNNNQEEKLKICNQAGGTIKEFSNGCANNCDSIAGNENKICSTMITKACDCGEKKCWDEKNNQCVEIDKYKK